MASPSDLAIFYRAMTNLTGRCPGCDNYTTVSFHPKTPNMKLVQFEHDEDCPVNETNDLLRSRALAREFGVPGP